MFPPSLRLFALLSCLTLVAHAANPLVSLKSEVLPRDTVAKAEADAARAVAAQGNPTLVEISALPGFDRSLQPVTGTWQDGELFVLATDASGQQILLRKNARGAWSRRASPPAPVLGVAQAIGQSHVLFLTPVASGRQQLVAYHAITDTWATFGDWPVTGTIEAIHPSAAGFLVTTRDAGNEIRTTRFQLISAKRGLKVVDYIVIFLYLGVVAGIGLYFYLTGKKDTANFFLAGRRIPWWAAGLSLYATGTSAISYLAIPAKSYATDWLYLSQNVITFVGSFYVAFVIVPLVRRLNLMSVYQYLELRFHPAIRLVASFICIVQHLAGRMAIVLLLPALALSAVTGVTVTTSIMVMGLITTIYTVLGGMKAVIWTDVLQVFVMVGGALFAIGWMVHGAGGIGAVTRIALADHKTHLFDWSFDFSIPNVWTYLLLLVVGTLTWPQDQVMTQRVLSTKDDKAARNSILMLTAIVVPGSLMFFCIGTALYTYYKVHPSNLNPLLATDQIFPQFIASDLPSGVTGMIIAGIFAASMATLSSNINSIATLVSVDFYERYARNPTPKKSVRLAEWTTVVAGVLGTALAYYLSTLDIKSLWDRFFELMALLGGGFAGIYALGMFTRRANWQGCAVGIAASIVLTVLAKLYTPLHVVTYAVVSVGGCMVFGYLGSYFFPPPKQSLAGLTIYDQLSKPLSLDPAAARGH
ncbi:MAG: sodium symporter family protein [Verrucomicrobia bacterium]|nr:sodium symporter family protein [Verrucomicrobiota bacterium]